MYVTYILRNVAHISRARRHNACFHFFFSDTLRTSAANVSIIYAPSKKKENFFLLLEQFATRCARQPRTG
jgi:hypothetical protein